MTLRDIGVQNRATYNVFVVRVQVDAALLSIPPHFWNRLILVGLMDNLGDNLRPLFDQTRVWRREFRAMNGVGRGIFHQQRQECKNAANQEGKDDKIGDQENQETSPHCEGRGRV